jgi:hypothetical protein
MIGAKHDPGPVHPVIHRKDVGPTVDDHTEAADSLARQEVVTVLVVNSLCAGNQVHEIHTGIVGQQRATR